MLSNLKTVGNWYLEDYNRESGWHFDEIEISPDLKNALESCLENFTAGKHSVLKEKIISEGKEHHAYMPSQYILYAVKLLPLAILLADYFQILDKLKTQATNQKTLAEELDSKNPSHSVTSSLDPYSRENFYKIFRDKDHRIEAKEIIKRKDKGNTPIGLRTDGMASIILKAIPVPDATSGQLANLIIDAINEPELLDFLIGECIEYVPYVFRAESSGELLFRVISSLGWMGKIDSIFEHIQTTPKNNIYPWDNIPHAFLLLDDPDNQVESSYSPIPAHYSESLKKYIFIRNDLIDTQAAREEVNTLLDRAWPGMSIIESTEGSSTKYLYTSTRRQRSAKPLTGGRNEIIYGAPGTGKSHSIKQEIEREGAEELSTTTVFHADTQYSDFVGTLKPKKNEDGEKPIDYEFRPGPFTDAYVKAVNHPSEKVYLVIEEINRAPAAAVFGEIFQLLDRSATGESTYGIKPADPDMLAYIASKTGGKCAKLKLPANLYLSATMNSSDQAVMPMDTAFKRRWSFRYMEINFTATGVADAEITLFLDEHGSGKQGNYTISWTSFAEKVINHMLKEFNVAEDRLIGPFFLNSEELKDTETAREALRGKLFPYIWDDVLRHMPNERARLFGDVRTYGDLYARFEQEQSVFSEEVAELIREHGETKDSGQDEPA